MAVSADGSRGGWPHKAMSCFHFDVPISLPLIGLLVHYRGWLRPVP